MRVLRCGHCLGLTRSKMRLISNCPPVAPVHAPHPPTLPNSEFFHQYMSDMEGRIEQLETALDEADTRAATDRCRVDSLFSELVWIQHHAHRGEKVHCKRHVFQFAMFNCTNSFCVPCPVNPSGNTPATAAASGCAGAGRHASGFGASRRSRHQPSPHFLPTSTRTQEGRWI